MGQALTITLPSKYTSDQTFSVKIDYSTTEKCTALGWLTPAQTRGKEFPYLYSQCQAIHARSLLPCQDTPAIKATYEAEVDSVIPVLMSALLKSPSLQNITFNTTTTTDQSTQGEEEDSSYESFHQPGQLTSSSPPTTYIYNQPIPIPSYLIAIAAGNLVHKTFEDKSGKDWKTGVWTEPEMLKDAVWEFKEDTAK